MASTFFNRRIISQAHDAVNFIAKALEAAGDPIGLLPSFRDVSNGLRFVKEICKAKLFRSAIVGNAREAADFIGPWEGCDQQRGNYRDHL
jgi:hypothetical protein